jgi:hypothetical protein
MDGELLTARGPLGDASFEEHVVTFIRVGTDVPYGLRHRFLGLPFLTGGKS